ncbi:MAG: hypothetical protein OES79_06190 [Planctomycetota bacterium]|nr:hypothetical protein [Planctomycetota bacterium]
MLRALDEAWADSQVDDPQRRHEEGGWIYLDPATGEITTRRAPAGGQATIDLSDPPIVDGNFLVGKFHTHPNPSLDGWYTGPSISDQVIDERHGVPDLIRADDGIHLSGPESRRGGLTGGPGYPS